MFDLIVAAVAVSLLPLAVDLVNTLFPKAHIGRIAQGIVYPSILSPDTIHFLTIIIESVGYMLVCIITSLITSALVLWATTFLPFHMVSLITILFASLINDFLLLCSEILFIEYFSTWSVSRDTGIVVIISLLLPLRSGNHQRSWTSSQTKETKESNEEDGRQQSNIKRGTEINSTQRRWNDNKRGTEVSTTKRE